MQAAIHNKAYNIKPINKYVTLTVLPWLWRVGSCALWALQVKNSPIVVNQSDKIVLYYHHCILCITNIC